VYDIADLYLNDEDHGPKCNCYQCTDDYRYLPMTGSARIYDVVQRYGQPVVRTRIRGEAYEYGYDAVVWSTITRCYDPFPRSVLPGFECDDDDLPF
jgi:hypothetical protein